MTKLQKQSHKKPGFHFLVPGLWTTHNREGLRVRLRHQPAWIFFLLTPKSATVIDCVQLNAFADGGRSNAMLLTLCLSLWNTSNCRGPEIEIGPLSLSCLLYGSRSSWIMAVGVPAIKSALQSFTSPHQLYQILINLNVGIELKFPLVGLQKVMSGPCFKDNLYWGSIIRKAKTKTRYSKATKQMHMKSKSII